MCAEDSDLIVSTAEYAMETLGYQGDTWTVPHMHQDDPARKAAHSPVNTFIREVLTGAGLPHEDVAHVRVTPRHWNLRTPGSGQAVTDGYNYIGLAGETCNTMTLLHECAHIVTHWNGAGGGHGPRFQEIAETLYRTHLSDEAADAFTRHAKGVQGRLSRAST